MTEQKRPRKSLRSILMLWFLLFSVVPLAFITGYSIVKYEQAIDQELSKRLKGNGREIEVILNDFEANLIKANRRHSTDKSLVYYLSRGNLSRVRDIMTKWMRSSFAHRMWLHNRDGRLEVALFRDAQGEIQRKKNLEAGDVYLNEEFLERFEQQGFRTFVDFQQERDARGAVTGGRVDLVVMSKIQSKSDRLVGYLEEVISMDEVFLENLKSRLNLEIFFFRPDRKEVVATHEDLAEYQAAFFQDYADEGEDNYFDLTIRDEPYRFRLQPLSWGSTDFYMGIGASKSAAKSVLRNVNYAFFTVVGAIIFLLVILSVVTSKVILKPLYDVLDAIKTMDLNKGATKIPATNDTELGLLAESFNEMSERVNEAQKDLKDKIKELESANQEIRDTQAKLVHTAKMASLGQLVAGVAHELNNPIGFIYSNMGHLRDYSNKLIGLVKTAESKPKELSKAKEEADFDYITQDMPKLIKSCEDGARRTRDIVLGLRNFSRLEEAQKKEIDLHESLDNTLRLLTGELKNRIEVEKHYGDLPKVTCYPSQLNQVFMNLLSNAAQAINGKGKIIITTRKKGDKYVEISIKDTGKGMNKTTVEKIFDPFFTTKNIGKGTGLGLSITYGIVQKHGGDIHVESEIGKGTEFLITLSQKVPG